MLLGMVEVEQERVQRSWGGKGLYSITREKELQEEKGSPVSSVELSWREKLDCSTFQTSKFLFVLDYLYSK